MSYESTLRGILKNLDPELFGQLPKIEKNARILLSYTQGKFPYFTPHDFSHSLSVEENLNWLLPDSIKEKMNSCEIFFLIVASWMHDWGMVGKPGEEPEKIREIHHLRTEKNFEDMYDKLPLTEHEGRIVGRICRGHTKENLYSTDFEDVVFGHNVRIRRRFLAALLRMADECDITNNRTPEIVFYSINPTDKAKEEFEKHLSISGIGQMDEKHKIYISAVARDPKSAKTLRKVKEKIQGELDAIKGILATNGVVLDIIELKLETRGFIDKPIGIEIDKKRIVDLLIGEHLYKRRDVAIRELIQNAIDSCKLKMQTQANSSCKIILRKPAEDIIEVEDNGMGMDYSTAKRFLSVIGASYYSSEEFKQFIQGKKFEPIARFGIGLLSCFLISEEMIIETLKEGEEPCKFTVGSLEEEWKFEKGAMKSAGTRIVMKLNKYGKTINVLEALQRYFVRPEIEIYYQNEGGENRRLEDAWSIDLMLERYKDELVFLQEKIKGSELLRFETDRYDVILGGVSESSPRNLLIFSHGIFVCSYALHSLGYRVMAFVNVKKDIVDLKLSREDVVVNNRLSEFIYSLFKEVFGRVYEDWRENPEKYLLIMSNIIERRSNFEVTSESELLENNPLLRSFLDSTLFPTAFQGRVEFRKLDYILGQNDVMIYSTGYSSQPLKEIELVREFLDKDRTILFNPYGMVSVTKKSDPKTERGLLEFVLEERKKKFCEADLISVLVENAAPISGDFGDIVPQNVKLVRFSKGWKPVFAVAKPAEILEVEHRLGWAYWANLLLWRRLVGEKIATSNVATLGRRRGHVESLKLLSDPLVYVDADDDFIKKVLESKAKRKVDKKATEKLLRYFTYLSYLPCTMSDISSCMIFFEVLDNLEREIADDLEFEHQNSLLRRIVPSCDFYIEYYEGCNSRKLFLVRSDTSKVTKIA